MSAKSDKELAYEEMQALIKIYEARKQEINRLNEEIQSLEQELANINKKDRQQDEFATRALMEALHNQQLDAERIDKLEEELKNMQINQ